MLRLSSFDYFCLKSEMPNHGFLFSKYQWTRKLCLYGTSCPTVGEPQYWVGMKDELDVAFLNWRVHCKAQLAFSETRYSQRPQGAACGQAVQSDSDWPGPGKLSKKNEFETIWYCSWWLHFWTSTSQENRVHTSSLHNQEQHWKTALCG